MNVQFDQLREIASYKLTPRRYDPAPDPYQKHLQSEFSDQHLAELFHENTKHRAHDQSRKGLAVQRFLENDSIVYATARIDPDYPGTERIDLPAPDPVDVDLAARRSRRSFTGEGISKTELATLLGQSLGTTGDQQLAETDDEELRQRFRAYPSGGGLYPVEHYVFVPVGGPDLDPGIYYYAPNSHVLRRLQRGDDSFGRRVEELFLEEPDAVADAAAIVVMTANFWRSMAKYDDRGYRLVLQESGHAGQNLCLVAEAMDLGAVPFDGFDGPEIEDELEIDGVDESAIYSIVVGRPEAHDGVTDEDRRDPVEDRRDDAGDRRVPDESGDDVAGGNR